MTLTSSNGLAFISLSVRVSLLGDVLTDVVFITEVFRSISLFVQYHRMSGVRGVHSLGRRNHRSNTVEDDIRSRVNFI